MKFTLFFALVMVGFQASAASRSCSDLVAGFEAMRSAQKSILSSLAANHETFAGAYEDLKSDLELRSGRANSKATQAMGRTADSFRSRGLKAKQQAEKLDQATEKLIFELKACLKDESLATI